MFQPNFIIVFLFVYTVLHIFALMLAEKRV